MIIPKIDAARVEMVLNGCKEADSIDRLLETLCMAANCTGIPCKDCAYSRDSNIRNTSEKVNYILAFLNDGGTLE